MTAKVDSKPYGVVYCITNKVNGKKYIGQTTRSAKQRLIGHYHSHGANGCRVLSGALKKYGRDSFSIEVLFEAKDQNDLDSNEIRLIEYYGTRDRSIGYNLAVGGSGGKQSAETVALRVSKTKGKVRTDEFKASVSEWRTGAKHSDETKAKLSKAAKNRNPVSAETRLKLSECSKRRVWTDAQKEHLRKIHTGRIISEDQRKQISATLTGRKQSADVIAKRVAKTTGKKRTPEQCQKISEHRKAYWAARKAAQAQI